MTLECVLDTSALVAYWQSEPGAERVRAALCVGGCAMHAINMAEFLFTLPRRQLGRITVPDAAQWLEQIGIVGVEGADRRFRALSAVIRLSVPALSVGDGFALTLASLLDIPVLTSDRAFIQAAEFARVELIR